MVAKGHFYSSVENTSNISVVDSKLLHRSTGTAEGVVTNMARSFFALEKKL
jgi:hypothetical protein